MYIFFFHPYTVFEVIQQMNTIKKYLTVGAAYVTISGILLHFLYDWSGQNVLVGFFSPVSESTWEHIKLLFFPGLLWVLYNYWRLKDIYPDILSPLLLGLMIGCISIPVLFYTYSGILGFHLLILDIMIFLAAISLMFFTIYRTLTSSTLYNKNVLLFATIMFLTAFLVFTYFPPNLGIFRSPDIG